MHHQIKGYCLILGAALLFGTTGTAQTLGATEISPWLTGAFRLIIGGPVLLVFSLGGGSCDADHAPKSLSSNNLPAWAMILGASMGVTIFQFAFFEAVTRTGVAVGTLVSIGSAPVFAGILAALLYREPLGKAWVLAAVLSLSGCLLLKGMGGQLEGDNLGISLAVLAGMGYGVYVVAGRGLVQIMAPARAVALILCAGGVLMMPLLIFADLAPLADPKAMLTLAYLGIFATALSYFWVAQGLVHVPVATASILLLVEPLVGSLLGIFILGESFSLWSGLGMALIFSGMAVVTLKQLSD